LHIKIFLINYDGVATSFRRAEMHVSDVIDEKYFQRASFRAILLDEANGVSRRSLAESFLDLVDSGVERDHARALIGGRGRGDANLGALTLPAQVDLAVSAAMGDGRRERPIH
jgi:hypothetical protein